MYMTSEHTRRRLERQWLREKHEMEKKISDQQEAIQYLTYESLRNRKKMRDLAIEKGRHTLIASVRYCEAEDDSEMCPLSLEPINHSSPPFKSTTTMTLVDQMKPSLQCAQLQCGHRFNAIWILFHFAKKNTFKCPLCRAGHNRFRFQMQDLPQHIAEWFRPHLLDKSN